MDWTTIVAVAAAIVIVGGGLAMVFSGTRAIDRDRPD